MLQVEYLKATYGEGTVLHNVSLEAKPGMVTCLVGRNGAGKSTTLRSIMGTHRDALRRHSSGRKEHHEIPAL